MNTRDKKSRKIVFSMNLDTEMAEQLLKLAKLEDLKRGDIVRRLIRAEIHRRGLKSSEQGDAQSNQN